MNFIGIESVNLLKGVMSDLINKNGLAVVNSARAIQEELLRGTGFVMADRISVFIETESLHEKWIVVSKAPEENESVRMEKFPLNQVKPALELFQEWARFG